MAVMPEVDLWYPNGGGALAAESPRLLFSPNDRLKVDNPLAQNQCVGYR